MFAPHSARPRRPQRTAPAGWRPWAVPGVLPEGPSGDPADRHEPDEATSARLAREPAASYDAASTDEPSGADTAETEATPVPTLHEAVADIEAALGRLAAVDLDPEADQATTDAVLALERARNVLDGQQVRLVGEVDRRDAVAHEGAVTTASWLRRRARLDHGAATQRVQAARRLDRLPRLARHLQQGEISLAHVTQVTRAAVPRRMSAIAQVEDALCDLALTARPYDVGRAVARVRDLVDADGTAAKPLERNGPDERRGLTLVPTIDGLWDLRATLDLVTGELLAAVLDACETPDPPETPTEECRSPAQRRHDALHAALEHAASAPHIPCRHGARPHVLAIVDVATLAGVDRQAQRSPRLRFAGPISPDQARRVAADARVTAVQTLGPWRPIEVSRTHRTLPDWLRPLLQMLHTRCRGPDCDRPVSWGEVHHLTPWVTSGVTDLLDSIPVCHAHHDLVEHRKWSVSLDPDTGRCTWTGPLGQVRHTDPVDPWEQ